MIEIVHKNNTNTNMKGKIMKYIKSSLCDVQNLDEIYDLLIENYANPDTRFHPSAGDFSYLVNFEEELDDFKNKAFQWRDADNKLVGVVWPDHRGKYYISTRQTNNEIYDIILEDIECGLPKDEEIWLWSCDADKTGQVALKQRNYSTNGWYMFYGHKTLYDYTPTINLPDGYRIRELVDADIPAKVELMGVSMGKDISRTIEKYYKMQKSIVYDRRTDLVVVDKNNTVVSFCNGWLDKRNGIGMIEPCGTSKDHAGKGLMTNLLNYLFMIYKQNGIMDVYIPHGGLCTYENENDDAIRLYKRLGFMEIYKMFVRIKNYNRSKHDEYENHAHSEFIREYYKV
jgi:GNAT superfamily N-acetyltransferase